MNKIKENVFFNYYEMIKKSWTYNKMTKEEKDTLDHWIRDDRIKEVIKGSYKQRMKILNAMYSIFLAGLGYNGFNWREKKETPKF